MGLAARLHDGTKPLHTEAERSGVMGALLRGRATREQYILLLSSLHSIYEALEDALDYRADHPALQAMQAPGFARRGALDADLTTALGRTWRDLAPAHPLALEYAAHLRGLATTAPERLLAHAWLRYLGDLNGGRIIAQLLRGSAALADLPMSFYEFPELEQPRAAAGEWRARLDTLPFTDDECSALVAEAQDGFRRHIALFVALGDQDPTTSPGSSA